MEAEENTHTHTQRVVKIDMNQGRDGTNRQEALPKKKGEGK